MKLVRILLIIAVGVGLSTTSFAKENEIKYKAPDTSNDSKKANPLETQDVSSDFSKLFAEADKHFRAAQAWKKIKCEPKTGFMCAKWECVKRDVKSYLILDKEKKMITRCEDKICEDYPAEFKRTGVYFNVQTEGPIGTLVRVLGDSRYKEISSIGLDAYIVNGNCEEVFEEDSK
jgi:hypothetical protein